MRNIPISFVAIILIAGSLLCACNKDDEFVTDIPGDKPEGPTSDMQYSVIEYLPAPGQYINEEASGFADIRTMQEACKIAMERLEAYNFISLGGFGGYIVIKFDSPVINSGNYDFAIACNSFDSSNEPGIVWVMTDSNDNGEADDTWYELKGSYYGKEGFEKNYSVTYYRPESDKAPVEWTDSNGQSGQINWMGNYHSQDSYYPLWISADSYTLEGTRLPARSVHNSATANWENLPFEWGYADNEGEDYEIITVNSRKLPINKFRISNAIDNDGNPVSLEKINFVKVQTAINASSGWLGEISTEVCGFFPTPNP